VRDSKDHVERRSGRSQNIELVTRTCWSRSCYGARGEGCAESPRMRNKTVEGRRRDLEITGAFIEVTGTRPQVRQLVVGPGRGSTRPATS